MEVRKIMCDEGDVQRLGSERGKSEWGRGRVAKIKIDATTQLKSNKPLSSGFTVTTLTSLTIGEGIPFIVRWLFFAFSSVSLSCSISCILNATFVTVWGPGLALRGPRGSMAKAYYGMVYEQRQVSKC